ncbi:MAG TPA: Gfo/Idh/MocA family oxidoreductase [Candidatus Hydrogenedentes bacterium]|nr:Gfo/Idh/MocA family oxidoreductase [Candidatus Hydrogenedentota bacterium]
MKKQTISRRAFLAATTTTAVALSGCATKPNTASVVPKKVSPNEKLNIAGIGVGGKGREDVGSVSRENIVALCDVDAKCAAESFTRFPGAKHYKDYRKMLEEMGDGIDAVTITTPDHTHAPAAYMAMKMGKHVYVQKPLTHTIAEARLLQKTAREMNVATQMGNQGHSGRGVREACEMIWSGVIGNVREVHIWTDRPQGRWAQGVSELLPEQPIPETLDWDLFTGSAPMHPYNKGYHPHVWRGWFAYGCGSLGDMGCHIMDPAFWGMKLGEVETYSAEIVASEGCNDLSYPVFATVKYSFPARGGMPPFEMYWYDNGNLPKRPEGIPADQELGDGENGSLFIGDKGCITVGTYGTRPRLMPNERMIGYTKPDPTLPLVEGGHYRNWIDACKGGPPACSNFDYAAPFVEMVLLGTIAIRTGTKLEYDAKAMKITNNAAANALISKEYRKGWELPV